jgi:prepilin-type processing-associated H-X9-DG protein
MSTTHTMGSPELKPYRLKPNLSELNKMHGVAGEPIRVPHPNQRKTYPAGGNILFADGLVNGVKSENIFL